LFAALGSGLLWSTRVALGEATAVGVPKLLVDYVLFPFRF
jgi:hypothetical protein